MNYKVEIKKETSSVEEIEFPVYFKQTPYNSGRGYTRESYTRWNTPNESTRIDLVKNINSIEYEITYDPTGTFPPYISLDMATSKGKYSLTKEQFEEKMQEAIDFIKSKM